MTSQSILNALANHVPLDDLDVQIIEHGANQSSDENSSPNLRFGERMGLDDRESEDSEDSIDLSDDSESGDGHDGASVTCRSRPVGSLSRSDGSKCESRITEIETNATTSGGGGSNRSNSGRGGRWFTITVNNPSDALVSDFWGVLRKRLGGDLIGGVAQLEEGETTHTPHIQGVFHTHKQYRFNTMKNMCRAKDIKGRVEQCYSPEGAVAYCQKEETRVKGPWFYGDVKAGAPKAKRSERARTDIASAIAVLQESKSLKQTALQHPVTFVKYFSGLKEWLTTAADQSPRTKMTKLVIYWGSAGTGKSLKAQSVAEEYLKESGQQPYELPISKESNVQWWPGYTGQKVVILNDFYGEIKLQEFLKMIDRWEYKVRTSGENFVQFTSEVVVITSNQPPTLWYAKEFMRRGEWQEAFERRIHGIQEFKKGMGCWQPTKEMLCKEVALWRWEKPLVHPAALSTAILLGSDTISSDPTMRMRDPESFDLVMRTHHTEICENSSCCDCTLFEQTLF